MQKKINIHEVTAQLNKILTHYLSGNIHNNNKNRNLDLISDMWGPQSNIDNWRR